MVMPLHMALADTAFGPETTILLGAAFDAVWEALQASGSLLTESQNAASTREAIAKHLIAMVQRGERNRDRLIEDVLGQVKICRPDSTEGAPCH
jgi:hypothetical protein